MAGKATSFDIAQLAGVSQPTVSRALRGSPTVSEQTRKRIEAIAQQLNYKVDKNASNLRLQATRTLALLFFEDPTPDETGINPFFLSMLGSLTRTCAHRGYDLLISFQQLSSNWHVDYEDSRKADGIILLGYGDYELYRAKLEQLVEQGTHFVRWGLVGGQDEMGTTIGCDNLDGGRLAAEHLITHGRKNIAAVECVARVRQSPKVTLGQHHDRLRRKLRQQTTPKAIVWAHQPAPIEGDRDRPPFAPHSRIHHRQEHRPQRKRRRRIGQHKPRRPQILRGNLVSQINGGNGGIDLGDYPLQHPRIAIGRAKVRQQGDRPRRR